MHINCINHEPLHKLFIFLNLVTLFVNSELNILISWRKGHLYIKQTKKNTQKTKNKKKQKTPMILAFYDKP